MPSIKEQEQRKKHRAEKAERKRQAEEHEIQEAKNRAELHAEEMVRLYRLAMLHTSKYTLGVSKPNHSIFRTARQILPWRLLV